MGWCSVRWRVVVRAGFLGFGWGMSWAKWHRSATRTSTRFAASVGVEMSASEGWRLGAFWSVAQPAVRMSEFPGRVRNEFRRVSEGFAC